MEDNKEAKEVYVITSGCYSDYHIKSIHLDKKRAERIVELLNEGRGYNDEAEIEVWKIDDLDYDKAYIWEATLCLDTGDLHKAERIQPCFQQDSIFEWWDDHLFYARGRGATKEEAIKIAGEHRTQILVRGLAAIIREQFGEDHHLLGEYKKKMHDYLGPLWDPNKYR